ncbi:MAG: hypothetical protein ACREK8_07400 [Gemmatimonadales bacterium]
MRIEQTLSFLAALGILSMVRVAPVAGQARPPVPGQPYQYWDVLEADGGARKVYFRNDSPTPLTITELDVQRCENTRQQCGSYPANLVVQPGKTVVAFKIERYDNKLGWSFAYTFRTRGQTQTVMPSSPPGVGMAATVQTVPVDSLAPAVAAWTENGSCGIARVPNLPEGHRALMMVFGTPSQPTARMVMVRLDANGSPYDYMDMRREVSDSGPDPRRSQITLDLVRQTAMVQNSGGGQPAALLRASGANLLTAASLGMPGETIARMVKECGGSPRSP